MRALGCHLLCSCCAPLSNIDAKAAEQTCCIIIISSSFLSYFYMNTEVIIYYIDVFFNVLLSDVSNRTDLKIGSNSPDHFCGFSSLIFLDTTKDTEGPLKQINQI